MIYDAQTGGRETYPVNINGNWNVYGSANWWKRVGHFSLRLDMKTKDILKQALMDFDGTLIVVSHDRDFLDGLVTKVYEFGNKKVKGNRLGTLKR